MTFLVCMLALLYVVDAETICSDGKACPEGTKCCTTHEGVIQCCDLDDSFSEYVKTKKSLRVVPSNPPHLFTNESDSQNAFSYCYEDINCKQGTCCGSNCCPHKYAKCCQSGCCKFLQKCCPPVKKNGREWCCESGERCGTYIEDICLDKGSSLAPQFIMVLVFASMRIWLLKL
ncbi:progranulin-like [Argiope bruennichi]|uniref:progranulin-like n=1 Tax=Argiope bruennichi TaxID=94029 RepID=UPI0024943027|nr:progranulin-like [Argiope bruennichi]